MYSDGLVERRGEAIDDGIDRLGETLARADDAPAWESGRRWSGAIPTTMSRSSLFVGPRAKPSGGEQIGGKQS